MGGHPSLDFCNTLAGWGQAEPREYLATYPHLAVWAREAGLIGSAATARVRADAENDPGGATRTLERARALRAQLYSACTDRAAGAAWETVAEEFRAAAAASVLVPDASPGRRWLVPEDTGLALPLLEVARRAGELLASVELDHVGRCPGEGCGWLFLDPRGRRRWCTMAVCGNRAKARRHARRTRTGTGTQTRSG